MPKILPSWPSLEDFTSLRCATVRKRWKIPPKLLARRASVDYQLLLDWEDARCAVDPDIQERLFRTLSGLVLVKAQLTIGAIEAELEAIPPKYRPMRVGGSVHEMPPFDRAPPISNEDI